ncbi:MAG TPA: DUF6036 family nucleotidyltransferase [Pyrinomonadaceae bacterium]|nr:DUF6036 family nucleotidyltransferase [Pyrinomonadaceae bacterium]
MTAEEIEKYLSEINDELAEKETIGEICIYGGAAMCLAFKARPATKDVDAIFEPVKTIRGAINKIADKYNLNEGWLNLAVKIFVVEHEKQILLDFSNLKVFAPVPDYLLAMKVLALRAESFDAEDVSFLIKHLNLKTTEDIISIIENYYPKKEIKPETIFQLEEIFENLK